MGLFRYLGDEKILGAFLIFMIWLSEAFAMGNLLGSAQEFTQQCVHSEATVCERPIVSVETGAKFCPHTPQCERRSAVENTITSTTEPADE
jgi:hypothetical protein